MQCRESNSNIFREWSDKLKEKLIHALGGLTKAENTRYRHLSFQDGCKTAERSISANVKQVRKDSLEQGVEKGLKLGLEQGILEGYQSALEDTIRAEGYMLEDEKFDHPMYSDGYNDGYIDGQRDGVLNITAEIFLKSTKDEIQEFKDSIK